MAFILKIPGRVTCILMLQIPLSPLKTELPLDVNDCFVLMPLDGVLCDSV